MNRNKYLARRIIGGAVALLLLVGLGFGLKALIGTAVDMIRHAGENVASPTGSASGGTGGLFGDPEPSWEPLTGEEEILDFLMRMDVSEAPRVADRLESLCLRWDVTGYYANLYQAALRASAPEMNASGNASGNADGDEENTAGNTAGDAAGDAAASYRAALEMYASAEVRMQLAQALEKQGDAAGALVEYAALLPDEAAYERILILQPDPIRICDLLIKKGMYTKAKDYATGMRAETTDPALLSALSTCEAVAAAAAGEYETARNQFEMLPEAARPGGDSLAEGAGDAAVAGSTTGSAVALSFEEPVSVAWWYARSLEAVGETENAITLYGKLGAAGAERLGGLLEKKDQLADAAAAYLSAPTSNAKWVGAKLSERLGRTSTAIETYQLLAERDDRLADDAAYRAYVLLRRQGKADGEEAKQCLVVLSEHPSWMLRLGMEPVWPETVAGTPARPDWLDRAQQFEREGKDALYRLQYAICTKRGTASEKLYLAQWQLEKGDLYTSVVWGMRALTEEKSVAAYRFAYPEAFPEEVDAFSAEFNVEPMLIRSVMRTESTYRAEVLSRSGAIGLMQIMPATGQDIAGRLGVTITDADLKNPEVNVRFGAYYIGALLKQFDGNRDQALAAYNGGPGNVRKWSRDTLMKQSEDFPTIIAYEESREYITKVMDAYLTYQWLETLP